MASNIGESAVLAKELVGKIQQFLSHQAELNGDLSDAGKESLTVAMECIEQAYSLERRPASNELMDIYRSHKQQQSSSSGGGGGQADAAANQQQQLFQNLTSTLFSNLVGGAAAATATATPTPTPQTETPVTQAATAETQAAEAKTARKQATEAEKLAAESFKNQGNDLMKEDKFREAYDCYTRAIEIDNNNAIYYSNRAAASSKLGDHQAALSDCQEAIDIDPRYSKAYGRMGLAYASMDNHQKAKEAYVKAVELDPNNESYRNNLQIADEHLNEPPVGAANLAGGLGGAGGAQNNNIADILRSVMGNQEVMSMAMRSLQDPRMQNVFGNILGGVVGNMATNVAGAAAGGGGGGGVASGQAGATTGAATTGAATNTDGSSTTAPRQQQDTANTTQSSQQQQQQNTSNPNNPSSGTTPNIPTDVFSALGSSAQNLFSMTAESLLSSVNNSDPNAIADRLRQFMNPPAQQDNNRDDRHDRNPPPGYS